MVTAVPKQAVKITGTVRLALKSTVTRTVCLTVFFLIMTEIKASGISMKNLRNALKITDFKNFLYKFY